MMFNCILLAAAIGVAHGAVTKMPVMCDQEAPLAPAMDGTMFHYPAYCNSTVTVKIHYDSANTMSIMFTDISFKNGSMVDDGAKLTVTVQDHTGVIIICDSTNMNRCFERASSTNMAFITFMPQNVTSNGYSVEFTATPKLKTAVKGYVDCRYNSAGPMTDGNVGMANVTIDANNVTMLNLRAPSCVGTTFMWTLMADLDQTFNMTLDDVSSIFNTTMTVPAMLSGQMIDVYGDMLPVATNQLFVNQSTMMNQGMMYSSQFMLTFNVMYMSYADMMKSMLALPGTSTLSVTTYAQPMGNVTDVDMFMLDAGKSKPVKASQQYDFANRVYQWEIMVMDKDKANHNVNWEQNSCMGLTANNKVVVREMSSNGNIVKSFDTCAKMMELKAMSTGKNKVYVQYIRSNASLVTGDWTYMFSSMESNSSSMPMVSMLTMVLAAVMVMFK